MYALDHNFVRPKGLVKKQIDQNGINLKNKD